MAVRPVKAAAVDAAVSAVVCALKRLGLAAQAETVGMAAAAARAVLAAAGHRSASPPIVVANTQLLQTFTPSAPAGSAVRRMALRASNPRRMVFN